MQLAGRNAIVTGAARGIGAAVARAYAREGAGVAVVDLDEAAAREVAQSIVGSGGRAVGIACDVARRDRVDAMVAEATRALGPVDILVNNAGVIRPAMLHKMTVTEKTRPVSDYLALQRRYRGLPDADVATLQAEIDGGWAKLVERARASRSEAVRAA